MVFWQMWFPANLSVWYFSYVRALIIITTHHTRRVSQAQLAEPDRPPQSGRHRLLEGCAAPLRSPHSSQTRAAACCLVSRVSTMAPGGSPLSPALELYLQLRVFKGHVALTVARLCPSITTQLLQLLMKSPTRQL